MKAAFLYGKEDIRLQDLELTQMDEHGLLLRVLSCGICGSDMRMYFNGATPRYIQPVVLGHEFCGEIVQIGGAIQDYAIGDRVVVSPIIPCMRCSACASGKDNLCEHGQVIGTNMHGAMSEYFYIPGQMIAVGGVVKANNLDPRVATMAELISCCLHSIRQMGIEAGDRIAIIGDGPIGMAFLQMTKIMGAAWVGIAGRRTHRLEMARSFGASLTLNVKEQPGSAQTMENVDRVIIATSNTNALEDALKIVRNGGSILLFSGYLYGSTYPLPLNDIHYRELHLHGSIDCNIRDFHQAVHLMEQMNLAPLVTGVYPLDQVQQAFLATKDPNAMKILIEP